MGGGESWRVEFGGVRLEDKGSQQKLDNEDCCNVLVVGWLGNYCCSNMYLCTSPCTCTCVPLHAHVVLP